MDPGLYKQYAYSFSDSQTSTEFNKLFSGCRFNGWLHYRHQVCYAGFVGFLNINAVDVTAIVDVQPISILCLHVNAVVRFASFYFFGERIPILHKVVITSLGTVDELDVKTGSVYFVCFFGVNFIL